ncbi:MAG: aminotransferase class I/II-fold pyridoxal phosphate-dependent enzyme, partial [Candidatus Thorarchaeota archaeon]|nr:aminotransferase class I/II-fold pyridoxal phosphate-dependent enzyme [Candidatus Thorarchaeota archaeon]
GTVKEIPVNDRHQPDPQDIEKAISPKTKCILLVSPNNPTGAVYDQKVVD